MAAETAKKFEALEAQAQTLMAVFTQGGYEAVAPAIIQPAGVFLDVVGERLRARTYVFTDPNGDELCLRPDLTVPICRLHLERTGGEGSAAARYCYNGAAFRFQAQGADTAHPREFRQAGIESFAASDRESAEAETVTRILAALRAAGLSDFRLRIGDLGLLRAVLKACDMPERWRQRLLHSFWRPEAFRAEVKRLMSPAAHANALPAALMSGIDPGDPPASEKAVERYLATSQIDLVGVRTISEIAANLSWIAADARAEPLTPASATIIESYLAIEAPARDVAARLEEIVRKAGLDIAPALEAYRRRLRLLADGGVDLRQALFSAEFGRALEYYTGFVFEIEAPGLGNSSPVAGGGRYDTLMKSVGAREHVPAVGAAIHTERLLSSVTGDKP